MRRNTRQSLPEQLFRYADRFARKREASGQGTEYPTVRQAAKRFQVKQCEIEDAVEDYQGDGYMGLATWGIEGVGSWDPETLGDCMVEAYDAT